MKSEITLATWIVVGQEQVSADVGGEAVILSLANSEYYGLNEVGARIWTLIQEPCTVDELCGVLLREYEDVDAEQCRAEVLALLDQMAEVGLIEVLSHPPRTVRS